MVWTREKKRDRSRLGSRSSVARVLVWLIALSVTGIGCGGQKTAAPVDAQLARSTIEQVFEKWKAGDQISACRQLTPEVVVQDMAWSRGDQLIAFSILEEEVRDANLFVRAELTLREAGESERTEEVTYCVGTDPVLTVFRVLF